MRRTVTPEVSRLHHGVSLAGGPSPQRALLYRVCGLLGPTGTHGGQTVWFTEDECEAGAPRCAKS